MIIFRGFEFHDVQAFFFFFFLRSFSIKAYILYNTAVYVLYEINISTWNNGSIWLLKKKNIICHIKRCRINRWTSTSAFAFHNKLKQKTSKLKFFFKETKCVKILESFVKINIDKFNFLLTFLFSGKVPESRSRSQFEK